MTAEDIVVVDLDGNQVEGERRPSTDTPSHLALYRAFESIGGIVHTHSTWATAWAQAEREIPILGTTHADLCPGPIPLTRAARPRTRSRRDYEGATGLALIEAVGERGSERGAGRARSRARPVLLGARTRRRRSRSRSRSRRWRAWRSLTVALEPAVGPLAAAVRDKHFTPQARAARLLRPAVLSGRPPRSEIPGRRRALPLRDDPPDPHGDHRRRRARLRGAGRVRRRARAGARRSR